MPLKPISPNTTGEKKIYLLKPRGFCAGVVRAIDVVKIALDLYGPPVYVRKEIVHNKHVVEELREAGAIFVEELEEVPSGARTIYSAHGVSPLVRQEGKARGLKIIDATCPLVTKVHLEAVKFAREGYTIILIGHKDHDEVIGTLGEAPSKTILVESVEDVDALDLPDPNRVAYLTQTTLSLDETRHIVARLQERFPMIVGPKSQDICYATENRQMAVKGVARFCDLLLVVGSANSSNSKRLVEVGNILGVRGFLVNDWNDVNREWLADVNNVAVTAGASAPEHLVEELVAALQTNENFTQLEEVELIEEDVRFSLPGELAQAASSLTTISMR
jgi:4-hydroxy-3-methylbut-2-enyl diphosphate reductase